MLRPGSSFHKLKTRKITPFSLLAFAPAMALAPVAADAQEDIPVGQDTPVEQDIPAKLDNSAKQQPSDQIEFAADELNYNFDSEIVSAKGNVLLNRDGQSLRADSVIWNRTTGEVEASGAVIISDADGNRLYGDSVELTDTMRDGVIQNILVVLNQGGRLAARRGDRVDGVVTLSQASYTACSVETSDGCPKDPSWQIKAVRVVYDPDHERVSYDGARIELFGLPVLPLPGLSHSVGEGNRSGLLVPDIRFSNANGVQYSQPYYFALAPNRDLTVTGHVFTEAFPMVSGEYRALTEDGAYRVAAYGTVSQRIPVGNLTPGTGEDNFRGYLDANGRFQLDTNWSINSSVRLVTDRTFLRRYDITRDDRLRSTAQIERIGDTSYFSLSGWYTQTLRVNDSQGQLPVALPIFDYRKRIADPMLGGRIEFQANSLAVTRSDGQDTRRAFGSARWDLQKVTGMGQLLTFTALGRGDVYNSDQNALSPTIIYRGDSGWNARASGTAAAEMSWPLAGQFLDGTQIFTPRFQVVGSVTSANLSIPNEDARSVELEDSNLFSLNRFPGYDRIEDGLRFTYGFQWQFRRPGMTIDTVLGQSYRLSSETTLLPDGTGLSSRTSDIVGRTRVAFRDLVRFTHRYRLDKDSLAVRRNEIDMTVGSRTSYAEIGYLRLNRDISFNIEDLRDREELRAAGRFQFSRFWSVFGSGVVNLTGAQEDPNSNADGFTPIRTRLGVAYEDDCIELGLTWRHDYQQTGDASRGTTILVRFALKNLGF